MFTGRALDCFGTLDFPSSDFLDRNRDFKLRFHRLGVPASDLLGLLGVEELGLGAGVAGIGTGPVDLPEEVPIADEDSAGFGAVLIGKFPF